METGGTRRDFLKTAAAVGAAAALAQVAVGDEQGDPGAGAATRPAQGASMMDFKAPPLETVRMGFVGVGGRGTGLLAGFLKIEGVAVKAVCDIDATHAARAAKMITDAGQPAPTLYTNGDTDFKRLCEQKDLDVVLTATPWQWHVPVAVAAMTAGKHAFTEVPAALTIDECWQLVDTAEKTRLHCMMLENCCYGDTELMVLCMARKGLLGEILHAEGAYLHDLRAELFSGKGEGLWRIQHSVDRNGNLYPTHGLGPVAQVMGVNRGDRFDRIVSMSSPSRGLSLFAAEKFGEKDPRATTKYKCGDINTSLIQTAMGRTIMVQHDTHSPHPYDRINLVQGTKGLVRGYPDRICIEGRTKGDVWEPLDSYREEFTHPLVKKIGEEAKKNGGHGGMDFVMSWRLIDCLRHGLPLDQSVYDAAAWSAVSPLSEWSVAHGGRPAEFPDFTRGAWKTAAPLGVVG